MEGLASREEKAREASATWRPQQDPTARATPGNDTVCVTALVGRVGVALYSRIAVQIAI